MPGNLAFYGMVQRVSRSSIAVGMPDGQALVMHGVAGQTDLSRCNNVLQGMGQVIEAHATANVDGSFTASNLASRRSAPAAMRGTWAFSHSFSQSENTRIATIATTPSATPMTTRIGDAAPRVCRRSGSYSSDLLHTRPQT
ncbi:MAG TPA: hypothetical protein VFN78_05250 [Ktedonobacterales bacterium]|nr:hypothetical protein [Ktedonobacterales bacterium]